MQSGAFGRNSVIAVRSEDDSIFWLARCCEDVSELQPRWSANYYRISKASQGDGDDEYSLCPTTDVIWRDVVLADITDVVRVTGKKLWLADSLKCQLSNHDTATTTSTTTTTATQPPVNDDVVDVETLAELFSKTCSVRRMVSINCQDDFNVISM